MTKHIVIILNIVLNRKSFELDLEIVIKTHQLFKHYFSESEEYLIV